MNKSDQVKSDENLEKWGKGQHNDGYFRSVLIRPEHARSVIQELFDEDTVARMDLDRLQVHSGTFVDPRLRQNHTDLLISVPFDGLETLLYFLTEHQSSDEPLMAMRMFIYVGNVLDRWAEEHPGATRLPMVVPVLVHQGPGRWKSAVDIWDLMVPSPEVGVGVGVQANLPRMPIRLKDLGTHSTKTIANHLRTRRYTDEVKTMLLLLRVARRNRRLHQVLAEWTDVLEKILATPGGRRRLLFVYRYAIEASRTPAGQLREVIAELGPEVEEDFVTTADMLRAEGEARGRAQTLIELLTIKFDPLPDGVQERVWAATPEQLAVWTKRVLSIDSLDGVLA